MNQTTKQKIIESADRLFYENGFEATSFEDISEVVGISRGNFYHHFKSKNEILDAAIDERIENIKLLLIDWEKDTNPKRRIIKFINILIMNRENIEKYGCPLGSLCTELGKLKHVSVKNARKLFEIFENWLVMQFTALGLYNAIKYARRTLLISQGGAVMSNIYQDRELIDYEIALFEDWLDKIIKEEVG